MTKIKGKATVIPRFSSEAEEAAWWDDHRSDVETEIRQRMQQRPLTLDHLLREKKPSEPITLRISRDDLATARRLAARKGVGYQTYIKMLLREALAKTELAERVATEINGRAASMTPERRAKADSQTKKIAQSLPLIRPRRGSRW